MAHGVTSDGFLAKSLEDILDELKAAQRAAISPTVNTASASVLGQLNGIYGNAMRDLWELGQAIYAAGSTETASGWPQDLVSAIAGISRNGATKSSVLATLSLNSGVTVPAGSVVAVVDNTDARFETQAAVFNPGPGAADMDVTCLAEEYGRVVANAGTLTVIVTPVAGWTAVTNAEDATEGELAESDEAFRVRRRAEVGAAGKATIPGLKPALQAITGVITARIVENPTGVTVNGQPPYTIECIIFDGTVPTVADNDIAQVIWDNHGGGVGTYGTSSGVATDDEGANHTVLFSRPAVVDVYLDLIIQIDVSLYPIDGDDQLKTALADFGDANYRSGDDVVIERLCPVIFGISGVTDIVSKKAGRTALGVLETNLVMTPREVADLDTGRIVIAKV